MNFIKRVFRELFKSPSIIVRISSIIVALVVVVLVGVGIVYALTTVTDSFVDDSLISESGNITISGGQAELTTTTTWTCGSEFVDPRDGKIYDTISIGGRCWMQNNLNYGGMVDATVLPTDNGIVEKWCYANSETYCSSDGALYKWEEAMAYSETDGSQGICPDDWHIPTHDEFTALERAVCNSGTCETDFPIDITTIGLRGTDEGTTLKDSSGFNFVLAGYIDYTKITKYRGTYGKIWSSTKYNTTDSWYRTVASSWAQIQRERTRVAGSWYYGHSVRCIKD